MDCLISAQQLVRFPIDNLQNMRGHHEHRGESGLVENPV